MRKIIICALAGLVLAVTPAARGDPFVYPPENNAQITWETSFPYQRNIMLDFTVDPRGGPLPTGIPGADYEGYDDPLLWASDFVTMTGDVRWDEPRGAVGIFDIPVGENASGTLTIHLDNWVRDWPVKHLYEEIVFELDPEVGGETSLSIGNVVPSGFSVTDWWYDDDPPFGEHVAWYEIEPNPAWEEKVFTFNVTGGGSMYLDSVHIATECVPVPGAVLLGMLGLSVAGIKLRKYA